MDARSALRRDAATPEAPLTIDLVRATWAEMLDLPAVGSHDDFFELGGNSLMVAAATARLGEQLGVDLPLRALFAAPTPAEMAEYIAARSHAADDPPNGITPFFPDWVVPLQTAGTERPVFVFPAAHHEPTALAIEAELAAHVGHDHPFWGFGRDNAQLADARAAGIAALSAEYVAQIRIIQERGPYLLYGNCAGGYLAWEVARQLLAAGEEIAGLLFFEVPLRDDLSSLTRHYHPTVLPVCLNHLTTQFWHDRGWGEPWRQVARGDYEVVVIPGETERSFDRRAERIARHVRDWIAQAEARARDR